MDVTVAFPGKLKVIVDPCDRRRARAVRRLRVRRRGPQGRPGKVVAGPDGSPSKTARQQFVRLGEARGDFVAVTEGLKPGRRS